MVRHFAAIVLLACFLALGSGALEYLHALEHQRQDSALAQRNQTPQPYRPIHNDLNCAIHAMLHMPMVCAALAALLICLGIVTAFLGLPASTLLAQQWHAAFNCRGPPCA